MKTGSWVLPSKRFKQRILWTFLCSMVLIGISFFIGFNPTSLFTDFHYVWEVIGEMLPPDFSGLWKSPAWIIAIGETISMAFLGTVIGSSLSLILAFLCAKNTMPFSWIRILVLSFLTSLRSIPTLTFLMIFVIAVGIGPFSGFLTLLIITLGTFARLFSETIENIDPKPSESIESVGAGNLQIIRFAILPEILPNFIANILFSFDVNIRTAIALGVLGGGGIGYQFDEAMRVLHYRQAMAVVFIIILLIIPMEKVSDYQRKKLLGPGLIS